MTTSLGKRPLGKTAGKRVARVSPLVCASRKRLRERAAVLIGDELRLIPVAEFEHLDQDDTPIVAAEEVLEEIGERSARQRKASEVLASKDSESRRAVRHWQTADPLLEFAQEQILFRALNLLRIRINRMKGRLSLNRPSRRLVEQIEIALALVERIRTQLVNSNLRLVTSIARKFSANGGDTDEYSSDGCLILLGAIDRFDYSRGYRFSTYATHSIQRHFFRVWKVSAKRKERFPSAPAELLCDVAERVDEDVIFEDPDSIVGNLLAHADSVLDDREHRILIDRFGLPGGDRKQRTLRDIAADLGLSKERVRQLQMKALQKLRDFLELGPVGNDRQAAYC